jgi:DNA helicase-2/ATP-dependent DNA helicase PcrA
MKPTKQQQLIIDSPNNLAIVANPGSGKTFVLSQKIKKILPDAIDYKGVIAISYTNKASNELRIRCLKDGLYAKGSFFGTIDTFYLSEIIIPFAKQLYGFPDKEIKIIRRQDLPEKIRDQMNWVDDVVDGDKVSQAHKDFLKIQFLAGNIILESVGLFALVIFDDSAACRKYLKARYTHIIIDEYQDSGKEQHAIFLRLMRLGLRAIAVGDANQSIFKFSGKSPEFLLQLARDKDNFEVIALDYNHRCHASIVNYSLLILNSKAALLDCNHINVFEKSILGNEVEIAKWLDIAIPKYVEAFNVSKRNEIAILARSGRTGKIISDHLSIEHKYFKSTELEESFSVWSKIFADLLSSMFNPKSSITTLIEKYIDTTYYRTQASIVYREVIKLKKLFLSPADNIIEILTSLEAIARILAPTQFNQDSIDLLRDVLSDSTLLDSYKPATENEVQIMTLHKSKGLEFDLVFHLDLYKYIMPKRKSTNFDEWEDLKQDLNLHYVGVTRARKACILCHSTKRTNFENKEKRGEPSELLQVDFLRKHRLNSIY